MPPPNERVFFLTDASPAACQAVRQQPAKAVRHMPPPVVTNLGANRHEIVARLPQPLRWKEGGEGLAVSSRDAQTALSTTGVRSCLAYVFLGLGGHCAVHLSDRFFTMDEAERVAAAGKSCIGTITPDMCDLAKIITAAVNKVGATSCVLIGGMGAQMPLCHRAADKLWPFLVAILKAREMDGEEDRGSNRAVEVLVMMAKGQVTAPSITYPAFVSHKFHENEQQYTRDLNRACSILAHGIKYAEQCAREAEEAEKAAKAKTARGEDADEVDEKDLTSKAEEASWYVAKMIEAGQMAAYSGSINFAGFNYGRASNEFSKSPIYERVIVPYVVGKLDEPRDIKGQSESILKDLGVQVISVDTDERNTVTDAGVSVVSHDNVVYYFNDSALPPTAFRSLSRHLQIFRQHDPHSTRGVVFTEDDENVERTTYKKK